LLRSQGQSEAQSAQIAEPERQPGDEADLRHLDEAQSPWRIDPQTHRATAKQADTQAMSNRRGGEARESGNGVWHLAPADGTQGEVVIEGERAVTDENKSAGSERGVKRR